MDRRLDLDPTAAQAGCDEFAVGVGFHGLVEGLKRRSDLHPLAQEKLADIAANAPSVVDGLREAGHYLDPLSANSGAEPTWAFFDKQVGEL